MTEQRSARPRGPTDLLLEVRRDSARGLRAQLEDGLRAAIRDRRLVVGDRLPASRVLAADLGVARGLVVEAYAQLAAEGWVVTRPGSGTRVAPAPGGTAASGAGADPLPAGWWARSGHPAAGGGAAAFDFRPGLPDLTVFPRPAWLAAVRRALGSLPDAALGYGDPRGAIELRTALAAYLGRVRGVVTDPGRVIVCGGYAQALGLVGRVLADRGVTRMAVEDPGSPGLRTVLDAHGVRPVAVETDAAGIVPAALARADVGAVLVMPAHQFPTGVVLPPARRAAVLDWARAHAAVVLEDDYDAEFRYDREPVGSLQGRAPERVLYGGSVSKTLAPGLRLGWLAAPADLVGPLAQAKLDTDLGSPTLDQLALADLLTSGAYDRHLRRARRRYRARRDALVTALAESLPAARVTGAAAGLHAVVELPADVDETALVDQAATCGVRVYGMRGYRADGGAGPPALVLGYGHLRERDIAEGVTRLGAALTATRG